LDLKELNNHQLIDDEDDELQIWKISQQTQETQQIENEND
jgi:hypothetical protein